MTDYGRIGKVEVWNALIDSYSVDELFNVMIIRNYVLRTLIVYASILVLLYYLIYVLNLVSIDLKYYTYLSTVTIFERNIKIEIFFDTTFAFFLS